METRAKGMKFIKFYVVFAILLLSFFPRIFSLDAHWSSDETRWLRRSQAFASAVQEGRFNGTQQSYHPGVTTMWLAGVSLWLKYKHALFFAKSSILTPLVSLDNLVKTRLSISISISFIICLAVLLIWQLLNARIALISGLFMIYDPLFLAQSRRLHTDALAAAFLLLATLTFLLYLEASHKRYYLILSGISFGLSCLSKSVSFIFLLWVPIVFVVYQKSTDDLKKGLSLLSMIYAFLSWLSIACLTFISLWPVFWGISIKIGNLFVPLFGFIALCLLGVTVLSYRKLKALANSQSHLKKDERKVYLKIFVIPTAGVCLSVPFVLKIAYPVILRIHWALTTPHEVAHFFMGKIVRDPGWIFYPVMLSVKSAPLTLPIALFGLVFLWRHRHQPEYIQKYRLSSVLFLFVILFTLCLSITAKKFSRYLLPVFPILDILAAIGLYTMMEWAFKRIEFSRNSVKKHWWQFAVLLVVVFIQVIPVLSIHPYYGTYYNPCWKITDITKVCTIGDASGLDIAAKYLNQKPNAKNLVVRVSPLSAEFFGYYFDGKSYRSDKQNNYLTPDYEVFYIRDLQIERVQKKDFNGVLEKVIKLNGVEYVWIYKL